MFHIVVPINIWILIWQLLISDKWTSMYMTSLFGFHYASLADGSRNSSSSDSAGGLDM